MSFLGRDAYPAFSQLTRLRQWLAKGKFHEKLSEAAQRTQRLDRKAGMTGPKVMKG